MDIFFLKVDECVDDNCQNEVHDEVASEDDNKQAIYEGYRLKINVCHVKNVGAPVVKRDDLVHH